MFANPFSNQSRIPQDNFRILFIISLKIKGKILNLQLWPDLNIGYMFSKVESQHKLESRQ
jgi:hypothetical protein